MEAQWSDVLDATARAEAEMVAGYLDGFKPESPPPSGNRSRSYRHGFKNGRADRAGKTSWRSIEEGRARAAEAIAIDAFAACPYPVPPQRDETDE